jgi:AraC-like DNA-binding protein
MRTVIETKSFSPSRRVNAFRQAICDIYANVDVSTEDRTDYNGVLRESGFGNVNLTECEAWPLVVERGTSHIASAGKECHFVQLMQHGRSDIEQGDVEVAGTRGTGIFFSATNPYKIKWRTRSKALYIDLPMDVLAERYPSGRAPLFTYLDVGRGLGRVLLDFATSLVGQAECLPADDRTKLGEQLIDLLSAALLAGEGRQSKSETTIQSFRLNAIENYIEQHLTNPNLSLATIAKNNGISLRYIHRLFRLKGTSPANWIWSRRLSKASDMLGSPDYAHLHITEIAFSLGFSSSSHFSSAFKEMFGISPSDARHVNGLARDGLLSRSQRSIPLNRIGGSQPGHGNSSLGPLGDNAPRVGAVNK